MELKRRRKESLNLKKDGETWKTHKRIFVKLRLKNDFKFLFKLFW